VTLPKGPQVQLRLLRTSALIALTAGAADSVGSTLYAGLRIGAPRLLLVLFALWVVSPFSVLAVGHRISTRWSTSFRAALYVTTVIVALASMAVYGIVAFGTARPKTAVFVMVAPVSWLLSAIPIAAGVLKSHGAQSD